MTATTPSSFLAALMLPVALAAAMVQVHLFAADKSTYHTAVGR